MSTPPNTQVERRPVYLPYSLIASSTWIASSRVGARISARTGWRAGEGLVLAYCDSFCRIGKPNPAVLPVPVCAPPMTSWPASIDGNGLRLDGRGRGVAGFGHGPQDFGPQAELVKARCAHESSWSRPTAVGGFRSRQRNVVARRWRRRVASLCGGTRVWAVTGTAARGRHYSLSGGFFKIIWLE